MRNIGGGGSLIGSRAGGIAYGCLLRGFQPQRFSGSKLRFDRDTARGKTGQNVPSCTTKGVAAIGRAADRIPVHAPIFQPAANIDLTSAQAGG